jgi:hypothetical protein
VSTGGDRRRHHWQLAATGRELIEQMLNVVDELRFQPATKRELHDRCDDRGAAA